MGWPMIIEWYNGPPVAIANFIMQNVDQSYITASDMLIGRAADADGWSGHFMITLLNEIAARLPYRPGQRQRIMTASLDTALLGVALVSFSEYGGMIEDFVVHSDHRRRGVGTQMLAWIRREAARERVPRLCAEVGPNNHDAQRFFYERRFKPASIVMTCP
jgi:GNAT superfamily N-acetyltransferase